MGWKCQTRSLGAASNTLANRLGWDRWSAAVYLPVQLFIAKKYELPRVELHRWTCTVYRKFTNSFLLLLVRHLLLLAWHLLLIASVYRKLKLETSSVVPVLSAPDNARTPAERRGAPRFRGARRAFRFVTHLNRVVTTKRTIKLGGRDNR